MPFRYKASITFLIISFIVSVGITSSLYAWWGKDTVPVPPNTEEVKSETRRIAGEEFDFTYYESALSAARIKGFYRRRLPDLGWEEKDILKDVAQAPGFQVSPQLRTFLADNLTFQRDDRIIVINFIPEEFSKDGKTRFTISEGKMDLGAEVPPDRDFIPELLVEPEMKDLMPLYPGASLINIFERPDSQQATYITRDDIEDVLAFYKRYMPDYGWYLRKETPLTPLNLGEFTKGDISDYCPTCPKDMAVPFESIQMFTSELTFSDDRRKLCKIFLSNVISSVELPYSIDMTTILVHYEKR